MNSCFEHTGVECSADCPGRQRGSSATYSIPIDASTTIHLGISLRDYFAAQALQGFAASPSMIDSNDSRAISYVADASYAMADAMLAARSQS